MKIKVIEATKEERNNLFIFLVNRYKTESESSPFNIEVDEVDEYLDLIQQSISIQKYEIELNDIIKTIFNRVAFIESQMPDNEFVVEKGQAVLKPTGKISQTIMYYSSFYELVDNTFIDITQDNCILFGYL
jgi:hypothetical protein